MYGPSDCVAWLGIRTWSRWLSIPTLIHAYMYELGTR